MNKSNLIIESNLSIAWARALLNVLDQPEKDCLTIALRDFADVAPQDPEIAGLLDEHLRSNEPEVPTIAQTALTIVPYQRWERKGRPPLADLRTWYLDQFLPRLKAR